MEHEGIEAFVGKRVHEVLERLYRFVADGLCRRSPRWSGATSRTSRRSSTPERVRIVREGTEAGSYRAAGVRGLENYYRRHYPFDADQTLGLEKPIRFDLDGDGRYALRGIIDRLVRAKDGALEIHDFKTSRRVPKQDELDRDRQLGLYELGVREQLGETGEVRLVWHYVVPDQQRTSRRTPEQRDALRESTQRSIDRIRAERDWAPRPSGLCDWCEFRAHCPAFAAERAAGRRPPAPPRGPAQLARPRALAFAHGPERRTHPHAARQLHLPAALREDGRGGRGRCARGRAGARGGSSSSACASTKILSTHHHPDHSAANPELAKPTTRRSTAMSRMRSAFRASRPASKKATRSRWAPRRRACSSSRRTRGGTSPTSSTARVFCGDTLFAAGCGRLFEGTPAMMYDALVEKLGRLPTTTRSTAVTSTRGQPALRRPRRARERGGPARARARAADPRAAPPPTGTTPRPTR